MDLGLKSAKIIVTAGAAGIGRVIVDRFLAEGAEVEGRADCGASVMEGRVVT